MPVQEIPRPDGSSAIRHDELPPTTPTSGGGGGPQFNEPLHMRDASRWGWVGAEPLHMRDTGVWGWAKDEPLHLPDGYTITAAPTYNDHLRLVDAATLPVASLIVGRSGTPDTDQISDGWVDQASSGTNHGNESLQAKGASTAPGSDQKIGFLQVDLTRVTGMTAGSAGGSLTFMASTSNALLATALAVGFAVQASQWFTESTMTYATGRPNPAFTSLTGPSIAPGAAAAYTVTFTQAQLATMIGNWALFRFTTAGGAVPDTVTVLSRDNATAGNRPAFTAAFKIP